MGAENVKGLVLPQPPRIIKKARRQRKPPTIGSEDQNQLSIKKFLEATRGVQPQNVSPLERVPTPVKNKSDTGVLKKVDTGVLKTLKMTSKRKFAGNDEISRKVKFMKLGSENSEKCEKSEKSEKSDAPHNGGLGVDKIPPIQKPEGTTLKSEANNQTNISKQNSEAESLLKIKFETDPEKARQTSWV